MHAIQISQRTGSSSGCLNSVSISIFQSEIQVSLLHSVLDGYSAKLQNTRVIYAVQVAKY